MTLASADLLPMFGPVRRTASQIRVLIIAAQRLVGNDTRGRSEQRFYFVSVPPVHENAEVVESGWNTHPPHEPCSGKLTVEIVAVNVEPSAVDRTSCPGWACPSSATLERTALVGVCPPKNALDPSPVQLENWAPLLVNRAEHPVIVYSSLFGACKMTSPLWLMEMKVVAPVIE